ncbi:MAG TPA: multicopper oxidase domain-containing protein, partial [Actinomycetota bacterium]|nr:multicopper oxidase domain-containing protein [Actinomycetota bacterium]
MTTPAHEFPTDAGGLPDARRPEVVELSDGDEFELRIAPVAKQLGQTTIRMLAYNGSVPGPTLRVRQGSDVAVTAVNEGDLEATVHWHGLRLDNRYDGTTETQAPIPVGGTFTYRITFPDPGVYWYHPHIREDYGQEMGLYGNILVDPLDDILLEDGKVAPFARDETTYTAMGRFGNVLLVNGEAELALNARRGEVVRLYLTDTANTRVFNVAVPGARMKRVGGDSGHYEHEEFVEGVIIAPSERVAVDVLFEQAGELTLEHRTPDRTYPLAAIGVADEPAEPSFAAEFDELRSHADMATERERAAAFLDAEPDKTLALIAEMDIGEPEPPPGAGVAYACPMHPDVIADEPGKCPKFGMKLLATAVAPIDYACPM